MTSAELAGLNTVAGYNQTVKHIKRRGTRLVILASDADEAMTRSVSALCADAGITLDRTLTMAQIGSACALDVKCGVCCVTGNG